MRVVLSILVVLPTGWTFGYLLARLTEGQESVSPAGILLSLGTVLTPALMALLLFTRPERRALLKQVRGSNASKVSACQRVFSGFFVDVVLPVEDLLLERVVSGLELLDVTEHVDRVHALLSP